MKNSSYYIASVGDRTHDLPHTVASNMVKVSQALNHSATEAVYPMIMFDLPSLESLLLPTCIGNSTIDCVLTVDDPLVIIALSPMPSKTRDDRTL